MYPYNMPCESPTPGKEIPPSLPPGKFPGVFPFLLMLFGKSFLFILNAIKMSGKHEDLAQFLDIVVWVGCWN